MAGRLVRPAAWRCTMLTRRWLSCQGQSGRLFTSHYVGLVLFLPTVSCPGILGDVRFTTPCDPGPRRQGVTVPAVQGFDPGVVLLDASGRGDADVVFRGVTPGTIRFELIARLWGDARASCPNCAVIYQSPGPFGSTMTVVLN